MPQFIDATGTGKVSRPLTDLEKQLIKIRDAQAKENERLRARMEEAEGLLLLSHGRLRLQNQNDLADQIQTFLSPPTPETK